MRLCNVVQFHSGPITDERRYYTHFLGTTRLQPARHCVFQICLLIEHNKGKDVAQLVL